MKSRALPKLGPACPLPADAKRSPQRSVFPVLNRLSVGGFGRRAWASTCPNSTTWVDTGPVYQAQGLTVVSCQAALCGRNDAIRRMTTKNRTISVGGVVDDIPVGGMGIQSHRTTSCGLTAVAQETGQTNIHLRSLQVERAKCNPFPTRQTCYSSQRFAGFKRILEKSQQRDLAYEFPNLIWPP